MAQKLMLLKKQNRRLTNKTLFVSQRPNALLFYFLICVCVFIETLLLF